jgi:Zn-dependent peptidase ImmA (M78 family)
MVEALVTPQLISWARKRADWTPETLAKKMSVSINKINAWENIEKIEHPSFSQAIHLSNALHIPLGYLYLNTPPSEKIHLPDLRTISNKSLEKPSPDFIDTLYDAYRKQQWYKEYLEGEGAPKLEIVSKFKITDNPNIIANDIRDTLGINDELRKKTSSWENFLTSLVRHTEQSRILVLRNGIVGNNVRRKLDVNEFRGFAIYDEMAPLVFVNAGDYNNAQIFTLIHEVAHIWIGQSGISNLDFKLKDIQQQHKTDQLCDTIAGEVLVPKGDLVARWGNAKNIQDEIDIMARHFRVSAFVVLRQAYNLELISKKVFSDNFNELFTKIKPKKKDKESSGDFHKLLLARNSNMFTNTLIAGLSDGSVSPKEASQLLNIKAASLSGIEGELIG